ncbi:MAG TPA: hypothetical protein VJ742_05605, partial [Nitrososphaera sp.]|nr:hypothetical protein [Nitrososphaera sp.]
MTTPSPHPVVVALEDNIQMLEITMSTTGHIDAMCDEAIKEGKAALPLARSMVEKLERYDELVEKAEALEWMRDKF